MRPIMNRNIKFSLLCLTLTAVYQNSYGFCQPPSFTTNQQLNNLASQQYDQCIRSERFQEQQEQRQRQEDIQDKRRQSQQQQSDGVRRIQELQQWSQQQKY